MIDFRVKNQTDRAGANLPEGFIGIGSGETTAEAVCRGLQAYLDEELKKRKSDQLNTVYCVPMGAIEDKKMQILFKCPYYLEGFTGYWFKRGCSRLPSCMGKVKWPFVYRGRFKCSIGVAKHTAASAFSMLKNEINSLERQEKDSMIYLEKKNIKLEIPSCEEMTQLELLQSAIEVLNRNNKQLFVYDLSIEPFF
ncbi:hypothetical protein GCM10020331_077180 [Ectobacillus funiculus]